MPPKKTKSSMPEEKPPEKVVKKRVRAVKPKLKIPTVVKVKIPSEPNLITKTAPKQTRKQLLTTQMKIDLANEVARAQLVKSEPVLLNDVPEVKPVKRARKKKVVSDLINDADTPAPAVANAQLVIPEPVLLNDVPEVKPVKRARKKKVDSDFLNNADTPAPAVANAQLVIPEPVLLNNVLEVKPVKRARKKKVVSDFINDADTPAPAETLKKTIKLIRPTTDVIETEKKPNATAKKKLINSMDKPKPAKKPRVTKTKTDTTNNCKTIKNKKETEQTQDLIVTKRKNVRKSIPRQIKGKVNKSGDISTNNGHDSPSILETMVYEKTSSRKANKVKNEAVVPMESHKTSVTSNSNISWIKDISSSSTTTCVSVTSNDFVTINKKMPIISLINVDSDLKRRAVKVEESSSSSSDSDSSSPSSSICKQTGINGPLLDLNTQHLNLSATSVSNYIDSPRSSARNNVSQISAALDRLSAQLKRFDLEIVNWIGYENESNNDDVKKFHDKITEVFKEESDVLMHCRQIKKVLADETDQNFEKGADVAASPEKSREYIEFDITNADNRDLSNNDFGGDTYSDSEDTDTMLENNNKNNTPPVNVQKEVSSENFTLDNVKNITFLSNNDDDDALSLFAESITGFESSRMNSSIPSTSVQHDEYIPEPISNEWKKPLPGKLIYCPTKIAHTAKEQLTLNNKNKSVCEKQNADSTSIKEPEICKSVDDNVFIHRNQVISVNKSEIPRIWNDTVPRLMASQYRPAHGQKSRVFRDICFYNLISSCRNLKCRFPHVEISTNEVKNRLMKMNEDLFIQEYSLLRNWPNIRRKYVLCYVEECQRRHLTRILIEMSIDSIIKSNTASTEDAVLRTEIIEFTLLHLNTVNLNDHKDLLMYKFLTGIILCDVYLKVISETQNFSRFKLVFINLVQFMIDNKRTFWLRAMEHILERVCILPYEEPLIRAMVNMIRTDSRILQNKMMGLFEKHLVTAGKEFYEEFLEFKKQATLTRPVVVNPFMESPSMLNEVEPVAVVNNTQTERGERYTSPDTTHLDSLNKVTEEPIITRTINNPSLHMGFRQSLTQNQTTHKKDFKPKIKFSQWKNKSIMLKMFNNFSPQMNVPLNRPPLTPPANIQLGHRQVTYSSSPTKYPRRFGPDI